MIRSADELRRLLDQTIPNTRYTRHGKALILRFHMSFEHDPAKAKRCRSVREQYRHDQYDRCDNLPYWL